jgi:hypothetical protein
MPDAGLTDAAPALLCPACGFDLRAATTDRCSECGLVIDREALRESGLPWAHRRRFGRVRAFLRTVGAVSLDRRAIRHEFAKPQDLRDARAFHRVTTLVVSAALFAIFAAVVFNADHGFADLTIRPPASYVFGPVRNALDGWQIDAVVPWFAGATLVFVLPVCLVLLASRLTGVQRHVIRLPADTSPEHRRRALVLAHYAAAPMTLLLPGVLCLIGWVALMRDGHSHAPSRNLLMTACLAIGGPLVLMAFGLTLWRTAQWLTRTRHCGPGRAVVAALELLALWLTNLVVLLYLIPWSVGFLCLVFDSLR